MSKIAVVYWSGTGNTEAMANLIADGIKEAGAEVEVATSDCFGIDDVDNYEKILSKIIAYGSADAVKLAIVVQECAYEKERQSSQAGVDDGTRPLAAYALLITQLKFDLTSEVIPATSWFRIKIKDYEKIQNKTENAINALVDELGLNSKFKI